MESRVILVVDDEPAVTATLTRALTRHGWQVVAVNDPFEALEILDRRPIDLVITDKDMPQMSGHMLLDILKDGHPDVPCVILTGAPSIESALAAVNGEQVVRYLTKPWTATELEHTVAIGLERRARLLDASATRRDQRARTALLATLAQLDPTLADISPGPLTLAPSPVSEAVSDAVRQLHDRSAPVPLAAERLAETVRRAQPSEVAEALLMVPVRHPGAGALLSPDRLHTRLEVDLHGHTHTLASVPRAIGDLVAARLAAHAGIDLVTTSERLGRLPLTVPGASGQAVIAYRHSPDGASAELRAVAAATDAPPAGRPDHLDKYQLLAPLGEGGMGTVYRAVHTTLGREVAIKILRSAFADDPITTARFLREARAAVRARHPRIVETLDFGQLPDGRPYLVMELVDSETLRVRLRRGPLAPRDAIFVATGIAEALAAAHAVDVIHRDLKPGNVFVDDALQTKLADFGAAKILHDPSDALTVTGMTLGTPYYMSPEHITGAAIDGRSDLYALGCVLYELLVGHPPYRGDTARSVLAQHLSAPIPAITSEHGPIGPALTALLRAALAKEPRHRPASASALIAALHRAALETV